MQMDQYSIISLKIQGKKKKRISSFRLSNSQGIKHTT